MTDAFLATVVSGSEPEWTVQPHITEPDGTPHKEIIVGTQEGITPSIDDVVLVLTMRNNLDGEYISRVYPSSESNGVIVGVFQAIDGYTLTGSFNFVGDVQIDGDLEVNGNITATGDVNVIGNATITGNLSAANLNISGNATIGGVDIGAFITSHMHTPGTYTSPSGAVTGNSGAPL